MNQSATQNFQLRTGHRLHDLPSNAFATMPDAALIGYEGSVNVGHFAGKLNAGLGVATSLLNLLGGVDVLVPFSSPRLWIYGYGGVGISLELEEQNQIYLSILGRFIAERRSAGLTEVEYENPG